MYYVQRRVIQNLYGSKGLQLWEGEKEEALPPRVLKLAHYRGAFFILAVGYILAFIAFLYELKIHQIRSNN